LEVTVHPRQFLERLRLAGALAGKRYPTPVLETVQFEASSGRDAWLRASDGRADITLAVSVLKVLSPGIVQLPRDQTVRALAGVKGGSATVREVPSDTVPIAADAKLASRQVAIDSPRGTITLATFDPAYFPTRTLEEPEHSVRLPAWRFARLIRRTEFAADEQSTRWALGGCLLEFEGGLLQAVATDGRAIAQATEPAQGTGLVAPTTTVVGGEKRPLAPVVSRAAARALVAALALDENAGLEVAFTARERFQAKTRHLSFSVRLPEGRFPTWKEVFPASPRVGFRVDDPMRLLKTLKEVLRLADRDARSTELRHSGRTLAVVLRSEQVSATFELAARSLSGERVEASVMIDPGYLIKFLEVSTQPFSLWLPPEKGWPLVCQGEGHCYALMPMERAEDAKPSEATEQPPGSPAEEPPVEGVPVQSAS
jgi:DNA polymerase-3 subunit beta